MPSPVKQRTGSTADDFDRTVVLDLQQLEAGQQNPPSSKSEAAPDSDATVVLDLTATQIHSLLNTGAPGK